MTASHDTVGRVLAVIEKYVVEKKIDDLLADLKEVPGNSSFTDTIRRLIRHRERGRTATDDRFIKRSGEIKRSDRSDAEAHGFVESGDGGYER